MSQLSSTSGQDALEAVSGAQGDTLIGLATLGKTALALALVIAVILMCSALLKRVGPGRKAAGQHLRMVASTAVGQRERVVIVDVEGTWLVLGVGGGQITPLHQMPAPEEEAAADSVPQGVQGHDSFASRFASALRHNAKDRFAGRGRKPGDEG
ncbi:flagellar protein FliO/FliZ [Modicisalibacter ilicicola DSM 19980]|uniref:Flagellar protein n=1 Tax=Modicisalibacter ilicicola DSM 19980 TaxID=1121942 RepID=A0A1M4YZM4_9GAMM|nr:flagellar biosynthetic protein FliO [Halomonas ilicicola]SHF11148.1 flagellar protein FliO/FliZ [Halomonas ilicicola DSM 19980]